MDNETYLFHLGWWRAWVLHSWVWGFRSQSCHLEAVRQHKILKIFRYSYSLILLICTSGVIVPSPRIVVKVTERMYINCLAFLVHSEYSINFRCGYFDLAWCDEHKEKEACFVRPSESQRASMEDCLSRVLPYHSSLSVLSPTFMEGLTVTENVLSTFWGITNLIFTRTQWGRCSYPQFIDAAPEA